LNSYWFIILKASHSAMLLYMDMTIYRESNDMLESISNSSVSNSPVVETVFVS
jgi:hypothetical protein